MKDILDEDICCYENTISNSYSGINNKGQEHGKTHLMKKPPATTSNGL